MRFVFPYNENLPRRKAHDCFLFREAAELARLGHEVHLLIGKDSAEDCQLFAHYGIEANLILHRLPLLRKKTPLRISWNLPFFAACQRKIEELSPDIVLLSVFKQAAYHLQRRIKNVTYLYEAHEVAAYPGKVAKHFAQEKEMLSQIDGIVVTTSALKELLERPPYQIQTPLQVISLAADYAPLPPYHGPPILTYVGQLYKEQGIEDAIEAVYGEKVFLRIVGGSKEDIVKLDPQLPNVRFTGFIPPKKLAEEIAETTAFIAPFKLEGRMSYVAHTKLYEYASWQRPILAPRASIVEEHLPQGRVLYENIMELKSHIRKLSELSTLPLPPQSWRERVEKIASFGNSLL